MANVMEWVLRAGLLGLAAASLTHNAAKQRSGLRAQESRSRTRFVLDPLGGANNALTTCAACSCKHCTSASNDNTMGCFVARVNRKRYPCSVLYVDLWFGCVALFPQRAPPVERRVNACAGLMTGRWFLGTELGIGVNPFLGRGQARHKWHPELDKGVG